MPEIGDGRITATGGVSFGAPGNSTSARSAVVIQQPPNVTGRTTGAGEAVLTRVSQNQADVLIEVKSLIAGGGISITEANGALTLSTTGVADAVLELTGDITGDGVGTISTSLAASGVTAGTYTIPTITVDTKGRITAATSGTIVFPTVSITAGTGLSGGTITGTGTIALSNTGVTAGTYTISQITVDAQGRITSASSGTQSAISLLVAGTGLTGGTITTTGTIALSNTGVTAGTYALATVVLNAQGRVTSASSGGPFVTSVVAGDGLTGGTITTVGTMSLASSGVTPGTYGSATVVVDAFGRITSASSNSPADLSVFVNRSGSIMTGFLTLSGDPTSGLHATTKQYVDDLVATATGVDLSGYMLISGGTMTGSLLLYGAPTGANEATTKSYVDTADEARILREGDSMVGSLFLSGPPTNGLHAATKDYVDAAVTTSLSDYMSLAGGTFTGSVVLNANPTAALGAATKGYVDTSAVLRTGGTMTGILVLAGSPAQPLHAATKGYVDFLGVTLSEADEDRLSVFGGTMSGTVVLAQGNSTRVPLRFQTGTLTSSAVVGGVEFNGANLFVTTSGPSRRRVIFADDIPFEQSAWLSGAPSSNQRILGHIASRPFVLPVGLVGSRAACGVAPTGTWTASVVQNFTNTIGTVVIDAAATVATFTMPTATNFLAGDILTVSAPASTDATIEDVFLNIIGSYT
jgi:Tfp pilus assembly major pilin PilA